MNAETIKYIVESGYLIAVILYVLGLRNLSSPATARKGNFQAAAGMGLAALVTFFLPNSVLKPGGENMVNALGVAPTLGIIVLGIAIGSTIGWIAAKRVAMTAMPEMVSIFNGLGGACAVAISIVELRDIQITNEMAMLGQGEMVSLGVHVTALLAIFIGAVAFTGSLIAWGKLDGRIDDRKVRIPAPTFVNVGLLIVILAGIGYKLAMPADPFYWVIGILAIALVYGVTFVIPIGGADMPVVISLLNAFTGVAAALAGLVYDNNVMLVGGILVGSAGTILTILMCEAMNRSLLNVIIGGFGSTGKQQAGQEGQVAKEITLNDAAILLNYSQKVIFVPGYGMAVAQAQKVVHELDELLEANGVAVRYAVHPVAGRMPGHMNVLLAEADVPYNKLLDLEDANNELKDTDVAVIVGANDVVNPAALDDPGSPIYGMPILRVIDAKNTIVLKRSMNPGYAGIQNPLFFYENNRMLFGDAKSSISSLVSEVKSLN